MRINVASKNPAKVDAVREVLHGYPDLSNYEVVGIESGLMIVPQTKTGSMDFSACAIYLSFP